MATDPGWEHTIPLLLEHSYQWGDLGNTPRLHKVPTPVQGIWRESGQAKERGQSKAAIKNSSQSDRGVSYRRLNKTYVYISILFTLCCRAWFKTHGIYVDFNL